MNGRFIPTPAGGLPLVDLSTTIDVRDDKNTALVKRAKIQATRNGPTNAALVSTRGISGPTDYFINSGGTIAGTGANSGGQTRGFLLVPRTAGQ